MHAFLPFLIIGIATGAVYALAAMGLVVTYTTSGIFNFAHGAVGMFAAYIFYSLRVDAGVPTWLAAVLAILVVAPVMGVVIDRVLLQRFVGGSASSSIVVSLGLLVALQGTAVALYGGETRSVAPLFPTRTATSFVCAMGCLTWKGRLRPSSSGRGRIQARSQSDRPLTAASERT